MNLPISEKVKEVFSDNILLAKEVESHDDKDEGKEDESKLKVVPYPWHVAFILGYEFCEKYSFYGVKSILPIYLEEKLLYNEKDTTLVVHTFMFLCYFVPPLFGASLADQFLGKFKTIIYLSCVYIVGHIIMTVGSMTQYYSIPNNELSLIGLAVIALGAGGIGPCVTAFAGDQYQLPEQKREVQRFFSIYYLCNNIGTLISRIVGSELRSLHCSGEKSCYPLAFGIPVIFMFIATVIIIIGKTFYTIKPADGIVSKILGILWRGLTDCCCKKGKSSQHWLDPAKEYYEVDLVAEIKFLTSGKGILLLFTPLFFFWCLFHQADTTWTYQANHMYGLKADQAHFINPALIVILLPMFEFILYPKLAKRNILVKPLERMSVGMFLTSFSFMISGILDLMVEANPNKSLHVMLQVPQYILLTVAEIMVSITGLEFAYLEASPHMKTILQACWILTKGFGNMLTITVSAFGDFENRAGGIFLLGGITFLFSFIFSFLAWKYVPRDINMKTKDTTKQSDDLDNSSL